MQVNDGLTTAEIFGTLETGIGRDDIEMRTENFRVPRTASRVTLIELWI